MFFGPWNVPFEQTNVSSVQMGSVNFRIYSNRILRRGQRLIIVTTGKVDLRATQMSAQMHRVQPEHVPQVIERNGKLLLAKFYCGNGKMSRERIGIEFQSGLQFHHSLLPALFFHLGVRRLNPVLNREGSFRKRTLNAFDFWLERSHTSVRFASVGGLLFSS